MTTDDMDSRSDNVDIADGTNVDVPIPESIPQVEGSNMTDSRSEFEFVDEEVGDDDGKQHEGASKEEEEEEEYESRDADPDVEEEVEEDDDEEYSEEELQKPYGPVLLPMPDLSEFSVPLPQALLEESPELQQAPVEPPPLAPLPEILHAPALLESYELDDLSPSLQGLKVFHLGRKSGLTGEMQAMYLRLPPGTRMSRPVAHELGDVIAYCVSGTGLLWQNGWTFPYNATDTAGWKAGTGVAHTIINDSNADGGAGEDLVLLVAYEDKTQESYHYPLDKEYATASGKRIWSDPPPQSELGPHPGVPTLSPERGNLTIPSFQVAYRPSNVVNTISELDAIGEGELFANATSLSQETSLSGRFGCNFEVPPPGARSSEPHAHSLEDELVYIVSGRGVVWLNGNVFPVTEGDVVGFPAGTGISHNFINDSNADGQEGEPLMLWILGQNRVREGDLVYYPLKVNQAASISSKRWWPNPPKYELGPHDGHAQRPLRF